MKGREDAPSSKGKMTCEYCGNITVKKKVTKYHKYKGKLFILENIDADVCQKCGEKYYHIKVLKALEQLFLWVWV